MAIDYSQFDVVFVGAGPVGLWTAVQTKINNPSLRITILDKDDKFQRVHNLYLGSQALKTNCQSTDLKALIREFKAHHPISTETLNQSLCNLAEMIGIVIQRNFHVNDPEKDLAAFTNAQVIVGTDGAHSTIRQHVANASKYESFLKRKDLHYIADLTYDEVRDPIDLMEKISANSEVGNCIYEIHSKRKKRTTLRTFVSKEVYEKLRGTRDNDDHDKGATRKKPKNINSPDVDPSLRKEYLTFLSRKYQGQHAQYIDLEKASVTTTMLGSYISKQMVRYDGKRTWCLVGDAAFGVPFFKSLNNGFICGTFLADVIAKNSGDKSEPKSLCKHTFKKYESWAQSFAKHQYLLADIKSFFVKLWISISKTFQRVPSPDYLLKGT